jgi:hypothetical protein
MKTSMSGNAVMKARATSSMAAGSPPLMAIVPPAR